MNRIKKIAATAITTTVVACGVVLATTGDSSASPIGQDLVSGVGVTVEQPVSWFRGGRLSGGFGACGYCGIPAMTPRWG